MKNYFVPAAVRAAANRNIKDKEYWLKKLSGSIEKSGFAYDDGVGAGAGGTQSEPGAAETTRFSQEIAARLLELTQANDYALHIYFTAAVLLLLHKYSGAGDLLVVTPIYKQSREEDLINRVIPLRNRLSGQITFKELLSRVKQTMVEAVAHQNYPLEMLPELMDPAAGTGSGSYNDNGFSWFETAVVMENIQAPEYLDHIRPALTFSFNRQDRVLEGKIRCNPRLYSRSFIAGLIHHLEQLLAGVLFHMDEPLHRLEIPAQVHIRKQGQKQAQEKKNGAGRSDTPVEAGPQTPATPGDTTPGNEIQRKLAEIWQEILGPDKEKISIDDNFFDSGGHSLRAMILASRIQKEFKVEFPLAEVFRSRTIREMARYIGQAGKSKYEDIQPVEKREYYLLSSAQKRLYFLQQMDPGSTGYNIPIQLQLGNDLEKDKLETAVKKLIARHESLRTSFIIVNNIPVQRVHDEVEFQVQYYFATEDTEDTERKNYKLQNTNYKQIPNHKSQITNKEVPFGQILNACGEDLVTADTANKVHHPLPLTKAFAGVQGAVFSKRAPWPPEANFIRPFDLSRAPLLRSTLVEQEGGQYTWLLDLHHIISDGTSHAILAGDFIALYNEEALAPLRLHYKDFSQWQQRLWASGAIKNQEDYWLELFSGEIPRLNWPTDFKRPAVFTFAGARYSFVLPAAEVFRARRLAANNGGTLYMNILAAVNVLFYRYTGQVDIIIGSGTAGRPHADLQHIIGMFVNMLAMRNYPRGEKRYEPFLREVIAASVRAFENQDVQFEELVDRLNLERDPSRNPLFDISMVVQNYQRGGTNPGTGWAGAGNKPAAPGEYQNPTSKFDLTFFVQERGDELEIAIEYYTGIFKAQTIARLAAHFQNILKEVNRNPYARVKEIDIIPAEEKQQLLYTFNEMAGGYPGEKNLFQLFAEQVEWTPDRVALAVPAGKGTPSEVMQITYRELEEKAGQLAYYLANKGTAPEEPVGILMSRAQYCAVSILGILKAGGAYVPLDPQLPQDRLKVMIDDTRMGVIISEKRYINRLNRLQWESPGFHTYLCIDSYDVGGEEEAEKSELMTQELWHHVGETAVDEIEGGGWKSSYTGQNFSRAEMDEYGDNILLKLQPLLHPHMRVLEIGCASGISMFRIAPRVGLYYGTDLSQVIIEKNKQRIARENNKNIKLMCVPAHEIGKIDENRFDLVIMNSVVQCFHGHNYLLKVIREAVRLLGDTGYLFIGDVMDLEKKESLRKELQAFKYAEAHRDKGYTTKTDLSAELFLSRGYWNDLEATAAEIHSIRVSDKIHTLENELTRFRYDVLITVDKTRAPRQKPLKKKYREDLNDLVNPGPSAAMRLPVISSRHLAYIIYTSGTTGQPRGVQVEHRGVVNMLLYRKELYAMDSNCVCLQLFSYAFDGYVTGFFTPLITGARLVMPDKEETGDVEKIKEAIIKNGVTHFISVPPLYSALIGGLTPKEAASLKAVTLAGDNIHPEVLEMTAAKNKNLEIVNEYGVTESSVMSTAHRHQEQDKTVKIGRPIRNTYIYILDQGQGLQPLGTAGELCIAGMGLARGYLNNPELTIERFCLRRARGAGTLLRGALFEKTAPPGPPRKNFLLNHSPIYRTGDLARWLPEGNIEFLGRIDHQVKIRGYRIELGEIESCLSKHPGIKAAVVIAREHTPGDRHIWAYLEPRERSAAGEIGVNEWRGYLSQRLPAYMIPSYFILLEKMPLNPNGKIDRRALLKMSAPEQREGYTPPRGRVEEKLASIWAEVLDKSEVIGIDDNFFRLGGHSLKATILTTKIYRALEVKVPLAEVFKTPTVRGLAAYIQRAGTDKYKAIAAVEKKEYYPLSSSQKRLYFLYRLKEEETTYNMPLVMKSGTSPGLEELERTFRALVCRHESLRTSFGEVEGEPVQRIHHVLPLTKVFAGGAGGQPHGVESILRQARPGEIVASPGAPISAPKDGTKCLLRVPAPRAWPPEAIIRNFIRPFDLSQAPLLRVGLVPLENHETLFLLDLHHIISDGMSQAILMREFAALYNAGSRLNPLCIQYKDYACWQNRPAEKEREKQQEIYWLERYSGELPVLALPTDNPRPLIKSYAGAALDFTLNETETRGLNRLAAETKGTLFMVLFSLFSIILAKLSGQEDIVIGTPTAGREHPDLEPVVGFFVNTLALRSYPDPRKPYHEFLEELKTSILKAFENREYPLEELVEQVVVNRDESRNPLFDVMFVFQNLEIPEVDIPGLTLKAYPFKNRTAKFDLTLTAVEMGGRLEISLEYCTALFKEQTIRRFFGYFKTAAAAVMENPGILLAEIGIIPEEEKERILFAFNQTDVFYPAGKLLHELFVEQAGQTPDNVAITARELGAGELISITYGELNLRAHRQARELEAGGLQPETIAGIMMPPSLEMIIGILGILKAGGAYLPIDPHYPGERVQYILKDSGAQLLVTTGNLTKEGEKVRRWEGEKILFEEIPNSLKSSTYPLTFLPSYLQNSSNLATGHRPPAATLAYVIYTSGTTGRPKGVLIEHRQAVNTLLYRKNAYQMTPAEVALQLFSFAFDGFVTGFFTPVISGARVIILSDAEVKDPGQVSRVIAREKVTHFICVPSLYRAILEALSVKDAAGLKAVTAAGEQLAPDLPAMTRQKNPALELVNEYGVTEAAVMSTIHRHQETCTEIKIGKPIANTHIYILDKQGVIQPIGVPGELCISGVGLARGYLNNPELTLEKFCLRRPGTFLKKGSWTSKNFLLYQTGDSARWLEDGTIEYLGRIDTQVKVRGYRIETGEIETQLQTHAGIKETVVVTRENATGERDLWAYFVPGKSSPGEKPVTAEELREFLAGKLPGYMNPSYFVALDHIPLTPHGKVDRKALPGLEAAPGANREKPADEVEETLTRLWADVLGVSAGVVGTTASFFTLGGHSLKAVRLISRVHRVFGVEIPMGELFHAPTIKGMAAYIRKTVPTGYIALQPREEKEYYPLSSAQQRLYFLQHLDPGGTGYNIPNILLLEGELEKEKLEDCFRQLIRRHEILRTSFEMAVGAAVQRVHEKVEFEIEYFLTTIEQGQTKVFGSPEPFFQKGFWPPEAIIKNFIRPFDLSQAPLLRVGLVSLPGAESLLLVDLHHIVADALSIGILIKELGLVWGNRPLPQQPLRYRDFSQWQNRLKESPTVKKQAGYWWNEFAGEIPVLELPLDNPRPLLQSFEGDRLSFTVEAAETAALKAHAQKEEATWFMMLSALFNVLLAKLSRQEDIIVGTPVAGRNHADLEYIIGMFVDTLVLRHFPAPGKSFRNFLREVKTRTINAFENQDYRYAELVEKLTPHLPRETGRNPLFDVMMAFQDVDMAPVEIPGLRVRPYRYEMPTAKFDLTLDGAESGGCLSMSLEFCTALFKKETIARWITYFKNIIVAVIADIDVEIKAIDIMPAEEKRRILEDFNDTRQENLGHGTLPQLFVEQAQRTPDHVALEGPFQPFQPVRPVQPVRLVQLTYCQLNEQSGHLAGFLKERGVLPDTIVGIMMERSVEMIIGILGILKAGAAYLPIDPGYPEERINYMLSDSAVKVLLSEEHSFNCQLSIVNCQLLMSASGGTGHCPVPTYTLTNLTQHTQCTQPTHTHQNLAYIIYTSGSTGKPKGVLVEHRNAINTVCWFKQTYRLEPGWRVMLTTNITFDVSVEEIFGTLASGAALYIPDRETLMDKNEFISRVRLHQVNLAQFVPVSLRTFLAETGRIESLQVVICGGDRLEESLKDIILAKGYNLYNHYGPTEAAVDALSAHCGKGPVAIGKPIANVRVYILHGNCLQPVGIPGELCIGGAGVARGYLNNPELTGEKFCLRRPGALFEKTAPGPRKNFLLNHSPLTTHHSPIYQTGDLARWQPDGNIEFLGRIDHQVKIRGYRIELEEIERQLSSYNGIKEAVVAVKESTHKYLCAYITAVDRNINLRARELKDYLAKKLPEYMVPAFFVQLEKIPLTPGGKVNRQMLPDPDTAGLMEAYEAPANEIENRLVEVWTEVLTPGEANSIIGTGANFFDLGGDSIKAIQVSSRLRKYGLELKINHLFTHPVIKDLTPYIKKIRRQIPQHEVEGEVPLTPIQHWYFETHTAAPHHFNHAVMLYRENGFDEKIVEKVFTEILRHHDALRMVYRFSRQEPGERENRDKHDKHDKIAVRQECRGTTGKLFDFEVFHFGDNVETPAEILRQANRVQAGMDLTRGPLVKLGLFKTPGGDHLLIVIHHLVIDGVSWRIVFEDFTAAYRQAEQGKTITLPEKTDSFLHWSRELSRYAAGIDRGAAHNRLLKEAAYWQRLEAKAPAPLPNKKEIPPAQKKRKYIESVTIDLEPAETALLLKKVNRAYNTEINDILLTALGMAIHRWAGRDTIGIHLEGHGRESIIEDMEIGRTVGWFTTQYPVVLEMAGVHDPGAALKSVKETLRRIPNKGIGYDILKYLAPPSLKAGLTFELEPDIAFNYLGQIGPLDNTLTEAAQASPGREDRQETKTGVIGFSPLGVGESSSPAMEQTHTLSINGMAAAGKLTLSFAYNRFEYEENSIRQLAAEFKDHLLRLIEHCTQKQERELTPSDVTDVRYVEISLAEFSRLTHHIRGQIPGNPSIEAVYPLSPMQKGMLYHALAGPGQDVYFTQTLFHLEGPIDRDLLAASFNTLIQRYDILRTVFIYEGMEEPLQIVLSHRRVQVDYEDIAALPLTEQVLFMEEAMKRDKRQGFDLTKDSPVRLTLYREEERKHRLLWSIHHILMDGWCLGIIYRELVHIYGRLKEGRPIELAEVVPYKDYIYWMEEQDKTAGYGYWEEYLAGYEQQAAIPRSLAGAAPGKTGEPEPPAVVEILVELNAMETRELNRQAAGHRVTLNTLFQALWGVLLQIYNNCHDVVFGAVVSGRPPEIPGIEHMVGLFINTVPVRIETGEDRSFTQLLINLQERSTAAKSFEYLPLAEIQSRTPLKGNLLHHIMVYENYPLHKEVGMAGDRENSLSTEFKVTGVRTYEQTNYDFNIVILPTTPLGIKFVYKAGEYETAVMERMGEHFHELIRRVLENPGIKIKEIQILPEQERERLLIEINGTGVEYPLKKTLHRLIAEQVERTPDHVALVGPKLQITNPKLQTNHKSQIPNYKQSRALRADFDAFGGPTAPDDCPTLPVGPVRPVQHVRLVQLTYRQLDETSGRLAHRLIEAGVQPDSIVGIMIERSVDMIIGILGILKAGGAYMPIDPDYPQERIDYMLKDSGAQLLVTTGNLTKEGEKVRRWEGEKILFEEIPNSLKSSTYPLTFLPSYLQNSSNLATGHRPPATFLAYVIYTSGSTGTPKGVLIEHRQAANTLQYRRDVYRMTPADTVLQLFSYTFDGFVTSFFTPVISGARVVLPTREEVSDLTAMKQAILMHRVSHFISVPALYRAFLEGLDHETFKHLKVVTLAGDMLLPQLVELTRQKNSNLQLAHEYGVTEAAVMSTLNRHQEKDDRITIGTPIGNTRIYIVDRHFRFQAIGIPGEMLIGGAGVSRGYLNNPELTLEKFCLRRARGAGTLLRGALFEKTAPPGPPRKNFLLNHSPLTTHHSPIYQTGDPPAGGAFISTTLYRTGDLARWQPDGNIEFLGRIDHQVKIRGFRIELGEIERQLLGHPQVKASVVTDRQGKDGDRYLCAYVVGTENTKDPDFAGLKDYLSKKLPAYMVPAYFVKIEAIPLNPNGKLDRGRLPEPEATGLKPYLPPQTFIEKELARVYAEILRVEIGKIGQLTDFIEAGGHSLQVIRLSAKISEVFAAQVPVAQILKHTQLQELARYIAGSRLIKTGDDIFLTFNPGQAGTIFCFPPIVGYGISYMEFAAAMKEYTLTAFNYIDDPQKIKIYADTIREIQPRGSYVLLGYSSGGILAWKTAELLEKRGYDVSGLLLIDCYVPENELEIRDADPLVQGEQLKKVIDLAGNYLEQLGAGAMTEKVHRTIESYDKYINGIREYGELNAGVHLIKVEYEKTLAKLGPPIWARLARKRYKVHQGFGSHDRMMGDEFLGENVAVIKKILGLHQTKRPKGNKKF